MKSGSSLFYEFLKAYEVVTA